ncbi:MAG: hypothetical protein VB042_07400 [Victivallaceae bacterium]|nr:hypothetical protein [Victivallaceae bacterium]
MDINAIIAKAVHDKLTAEECAELAALRSSEERLRTELSARDRREKVAALARDRHFCDPEYLDYLAQKSTVDLSDSAAVDAFIAGLASAAPPVFHRSARLWGGWRLRTVHPCRRSLPRPRGRNRAGRSPQRFGDRPSS